MGFEVKRYHDISTGHRVVGHEGKCRHLHGHNYRIHFICVADEGGLDAQGRVIDFGEIKERLCMWVEHAWDHKFLAWERDPVARMMVASMNQFCADKECAKSVDLLLESIVTVPFNPTAENMARHLVQVVGPRELFGTGITLIRVDIDETAKCQASFSL